MDNVTDLAGIQLDIGCGAHKQPGWVGMDIQPFDGVDIVHDFLKMPWPLPDGSVIRAIASHIIEHIPPVALLPDGTRFPFLEFMDEVWRVLKVDGQFALVMPYWTSQGFAQDPTHINMCNENTWAYFDPEAFQGQLYGFYQPKPWKIEQVSFDPAVNMEAVLRKRAE